MRWFYIVIVCTCRILLGQKTTLEVHRNPYAKTDRSLHIKEWRYATDL